ncbi:hypothetical protein FACS1894109_14920 [Spirochaetia bacterium]|nr:hypothetical protein FACS1894109_14920 [Spirochaetia bacterium]
MKKISMVLWTVAVLLIASPLMLSAGGGQQSGSSSTGGAGKVDVIRVWSDNAHERVLRDQQIAKFNEGRGKELGIKIEYTVYGTGWSETQKTAAQAGDAPELYRPNINDGMQSFIDAGYLIPIEDLPGGAEYLKQWPGLVLNQHTFKKAGTSEVKTYTLPYNLTTNKFIINRDLFNKNGIKDPPKTWAEVREYAKIITKNGGGKEYGFIYGQKQNWIWNVYGSYQAIQSIGHWGFDNKNLTFNFSAIAPVVEAYLGMAQDGSILPGFQGMDADQMRAQFSEGIIGMIPAASFDTGVYNTQFPAKCNWEVHPIPVVPGSPKLKEFAVATTLLGVGESAKKTDMSKVLEVLKFFYADENAAEMYEQALYIPYRQEAIKLAKTQPAAKGFAEFANVPQLLTILPDPSTIIPYEGDGREATIFGIIGGTDRRSVQVALKDLDDRMNKALATLPKATLEEYRQPATYDINAK